MCFAECVPVHNVYAVPSEDRKGFPSTGVTDGFEPLFGCWESNIGPMEAQSVLSISETSL